MLASHYDKAPVIIIDEYDTPIQEGYSKDFYNEIIGFMRNFFSGAFKDNKNLSYGFLTGILRIAQESIFSGLNNLTVNSVMDEEYDSFFGFTESEVKAMLSYYGVSDKEEELKDWYDGYLFGSEEIYNPWSVINYISKGCLPQAYWVNTGKNEEARDAYKKAVAAMPEKLGVYDQRSSYTYTNLLRVSQCLNEPEAEVEAIYKEAVEKLPKEPDFDCVMGEWYWRKGQYEKAVQMYELAIAKLETYGTVNRGIITTSMLIQMYECLGEGCRRLGDYQKAVRYCVIVLNTDHKDMNALLTLINCFTESNGTKRQFLHNFLLLQRK